MSDNKDQWRDTLNLPRTDFAMRAGLANKEPVMVDAWNEQATYHYVEAQRKDDPLFILHDGPPYANGQLHLGHVLNKVLKDIVVKFKRSQGYRAPYVPGWDCHGLPIELKSAEESGEREPEKIRKHCRSYALRHVDIQREEFKRLGVLGDWDNPYLTLTAEYEAAILDGLAGLVEGDYVERGNKPVHWCISCGTALAEAEVEYGDHKSHSLYVRFPLCDGFLDDTADLLIWTTTPWTLPANLAVAIAPDASYGLYPTDGRPIVVAEALAEAVFEACGKNCPVAEKIFSGSDLTGSQYGHPFLDRTGKVLAADFVELDTGTGMVHIAPGHGEDDYRLGMAHGLDVYAPVDGDGCFVDVADWLDGVVVWQGNDLVLDHLRDSDLLWNVDKLKHSYPHCWRCQKPIIFRATPQWFVTMSAGDLRDKAVADIERVQWIPAWGHDRILAMMENRPDWCISRQRVWGVPICSLHCLDCGHDWLDAGFMRQVAQVFARETSDVWFGAGKSDLLEKAPPCPQCNATRVSAGDEILDVWFDSGISWRAAVENDERMPGKIDLYLEGSDQHRGWFQSSMLLGTALTGRAPYEAVLTHGFVVDGNGLKMSKSRGNMIKPEKIWKASGAEILRIWCASEDYRMDVRVSDTILKQCADSYRRIRNTIRYLLGNLSDFDPLSDLVSSDALEPLDRLARAQMAVVIREVREAYEQYQFHIAFQRLHNWCAGELSSFYLDIIKDRLYVHGASSLTRRAAQTVLHEALHGLLVMSAPILSFTSEEAYSYMPGAAHPTVFAELWPAAREAEELATAGCWWRVLDEVRPVVLKALEEARQAGTIGQSLEASVLLRAPADLLKALTETGIELRKLFIVSACELQEGSTLEVEVCANGGTKCSRCWHFENQLETSGLCPRCQQVVDAGGGV